MATGIRVPGEEIDPAGAGMDLIRSRFHKVSSEHVVNVSLARATGGEVHIADAVDSDLVEARFDDGSLFVTNLGRLRDLAREGGAQRGGDDTFIPAYLPLGPAERGRGVLLKLLRVLKVDPVDEIAGLVTREAVGRIEGQLAGPPGLYPLGPSGELGERISEPLENGDRAWLLFLHGTASSTRGSFQGLFEDRQGSLQGLFAETPEWRELCARYKDRILGFEHRTLSESPAANALELARLLPDKAELHLVTHSRGGLVGELLCRGGFSEDALEIFGEMHPDRPFLADLGARLKTKAWRIERFVRVACPAAGTVLASDRLDLYLSLLLNAAKLALPAGLQEVHELIGSVLLEVARRRADASELPGLEAQRPESPFVHFLNRPDQPAVDQDLAVIAGDLQMGSPWQTARTLAGYAFFLEKNDLVVDTRAMYRGLPRESAWASYHEGPRVTHFSYFDERATRAQLRDALLRQKRQEAPPGFLSLEKERETRSFAFWREAVSRRDPARDPAGVVLVLPDVFGSELRSDGQPVWLDDKAIAAGTLPKLAMSARGVDVGRVIAGEPRLGALADAFSEHEIWPVPYDWRGGVTTAAETLRDVLRKALERTRSPVFLVAHGLGALVALWLAEREADLWTQIAARAGRVVLLAPPLDGSAAMLRFATGTGRLFRLLRLLSARAESDLLTLFLEMPGVVELLPLESLEDSWWRRYDGKCRPAPALLKEARQRSTEWRAEVEKSGAMLLFGAATETVVPSLDRATLKSQRSQDGDGWMINPRDLPADGAWFMAATHEALLGDPAAARVVADLLRRGQTNRASRTAPKERASSAESPVSFPSAADLVAAVTLGGASLDRRAERVLRVRVAHGSLDRLGVPVMVGHYQGDSIRAAEEFLDRCLGGRLRRRFDLRLYPGKAGTALFMPAADCRPPGALVVGLGEIGELTAAELSRGVATAGLEMATHALDERAQHERGGEGPQRLTLASLLIGTRGGRQLSVQRCIAAITRGILQANRALEARKLLSKVCFHELRFVELWSDIAIAAGHAVDRLENDASLGLLSHEHIDADGRLMPLEGARGNSRAFTDDWVWWRRLIITEEPQPQATDTGQTVLRFVSLTDRARAEERLVWTAGSQLDELLERAPKPSGAQVENDSIVNALYHLLLPPAIKESLFDGDDLVIVVDRGAGRYPWELLARRRVGGSAEATGDDQPKLEPVVSRVKIVRQFRTPDFPEGINPARANCALVVGNPLGVEPSLKGAREEGERVAATLEAGDFLVVPSIEEPGAQVLQKLFLHDYRIVHIAAHGDYQEGQPLASGVLIGRGPQGERRTLSAQVFRQLPAIPELVFLNCCHLGRLEPEPPARSGALAASVAEALIEIGVRCVIVAGWEVNDAAARMFAVEFYRRFLAGESFGDAVHGARHAVWRDVRFRSTTTWGAYQCYGDPEFRLRARERFAGDGARRYVAEAEAEQDVADIVAAASNLGESEDERKKLLARLGSIEAGLDPEWRRHGALLYQRAEAWAALGEGSRAIGLYRDCLQAWDARAPLRAAEQLANHLDRAGEQINAAWAGEALSPLERGGERVRKRAPTMWLEWADQAGSSPERWALRGAYFKRAAFSETIASKRRSLLRRSLTAYRASFSLSQSGHAGIHYYPGLNAVAVAWAIGPKAAEDYRDWIRSSRDSAAREQERGETLWNTAADIDADLLAALLDNTIEDPRAAEFARRYRRCLETRGTLNQRNSVLAQVSFLHKMAHARSHGAEPFLKRILDIVKDDFWPL